VWTTVLPISLTSTGRTGLWSSHLKWGLWTGVFQLLTRWPTARDLFSWMGRMSLALAPCGNAIHELPQKSILLRGNRDYFLQRRSRLSYHLALGDWRKGRVQTMGYDWDNEHCSKIAYRKYRSSHNRSCRPTIDSASGRVVVADCNRRRHSVMDFGLSVIE